MEAVAIRAHEQPALHRLVLEAANRLGTAVPPRVWLGAEAEVLGAVGARGAYLVVGLPAAYALSRVELTALVEHELAVLRAAPSRKQSNQYRRWARATDLLVTVEDGERPPRPAAATVRRHGAAAEAVERAADAACGDPAVAARAFIRLGRVADDFLFFRSWVETGLSRFGSLRYRITDLHDGWRRSLAAGAGVSDDGPVDRDETEMTAGRHPSLAARKLVGQPLLLRPPADAVEIRSLSRREQRTLAAAILPATGWASWRTFADVPPRFWQRAAARTARHTMTSVAHELGHEPAGRAEAADVIRTRPAELAGVPVDDLDIAVFQQMAWLDLLEDALLGQGWTRADPAIAGVLHGPDGSRLDGRDLTRRAAADPFAYAELRRVLLP